MKFDPYNWNGIRINISGSKKDIISGIGKYFLAGKEAPGGGKAHINIEVYDRGEDMMPVPGKDALLKRSMRFELEKDCRLDIYSSGDQFWYIYRDIAEYWLDLNGNRLVIAIGDKPFTFYYYNILLFILHPLGLLLENFGYYRTHASCIDLDGRALLITGVSGSGKSTAAFALASRGAAIVSDDMTFIKKYEGCYRAHTITRMVKLCRNTAEKFFPRLLGDHIMINGDGEMYFDERLINKKAVDAPVIRSILILEKTGRKRSDISPVPPADVLPHIFPSSIQTNYGKYTGRKFDFLTGMLDDIPCHKVGFGTDMAGFHKKVTGSLEIK